MTGTMTGTTTKMHSLVARVTDITPTSDLGSFEIVRRLPVTTWALRPDPCVPLIAPTNASSLAIHSIGRLSGWLESSHWSAAFQARLATRYATPLAMPSPRISTAWLAVASDAHDGVASVPPPPAWLPSILKGWSVAVDLSNIPVDTRAEFSLRAASWTTWLFGLTQPFGNASNDIANAHAARLLADGTGLIAPLVAGFPATDAQRTSLQRLLAHALSTEKYHVWHRAWLLEVAAESIRIIGALTRVKDERARLLAVASAMRAPRHCVTLAESLVAQPVTNVADAALRMNITFRASQAIVDKFVAEKILREITGRRRDRVFQCDALSDQSLFI